MLFACNNNNISDNLFDYILFTTFQDMDENVKQLQKKLAEVELEAEHLLLARHQVIQNFKLKVIDASTMTYKKNK